MNKSGILLIWFRFLTISDHHFKHIACTHVIHIVVLLGLRLDAQAAMDYLLHCQDIDRRKIILFGRSLGGAVAIDLASNTAYSDK